MCERVWRHLVQKICHPLKLYIIKRKFKFLSWICHLFHLLKRENVYFIRGFATHEICIFCFTRWNKWHIHSKKLNILYIPFVVCVSVCDNFGFFHLQLQLFLTDLLQTWQRHWYQEYLTFAHSLHTDQDRLVTEHGFWSGSKLFDTLIVFLKEFFEKIQSTLLHSTMHNSILSLILTRRPSPGIFPYILLQFHNVYLDNG